MNDYLSEDEIDALPEIKAIRRGKEPVPRSVLHTADIKPITAEDITWARRQGQGQRQGQVTRIKFFPEELIGLTDEQVRVKTLELGNGEYATQICRGCGRVWSDIEGDVVTAKVVKRCRWCMEVPE